MNRRIILLFLIAFFIRLIALNQSFWLDEATTAIVVQQHSFISIIQNFSPTDFHPPLYYLFMKLWSMIFGYSEIALRMPSVLFSLGAGWWIYKAVISGFPIGVGNDKERRCFAQARDDNIAWWSAAFFLFNPLIVYYSQEARMYSMVTFLIAANFSYFLRILQKSSFKDVVLFNLTAVLMILTYYGSVFYLATIYIYLFFSVIVRTPLTLRVPSPRGENIRLFLKLLVGPVLGFLFVSPLLLHQLAQSRSALHVVQNWSQVLGKATLKNLLLFPIKFTSGRISFYPKMFYYALAGGWMTVVFGFIGRGVIHKMTRLLLFFLIVPIILGILFSLVSPLLQYFRFQYVIIFLSISLGYSLGALPSPRFQNVLSSILVSGFLAWSLLYLLFPQFHREDWKGMAALLKQETVPIYMISSSTDPLHYYAPDLSIRPLPSLTSLQPGEHGIIVVPYTADIHGVDYQTKLKQYSFHLQDTTSVRELQFQYWSR